MGFAHGGFGLISFGLARITLLLLRISAISATLWYVCELAVYRGNKDRERENFVSPQEEDSQIDLGASQNQMEKYMFIFDSFRLAVFYIEEINLENF